MTSAKILIVEDEGVVAMDLSRAVSGWGHTVTAIAATAEEALRSAAENRPDLVMMDIGLRGEMDGIQAAKALQDRYQLPVIYLTAFADKTTLERAKATEPYGYALKPFNERELKITIEMALYRCQADQALKSRGEWLDATLSSVGEAMIATDDEGRVMFINDHAEKLTDWSRSDAFGQDISAVLRAPESDELVPSEHFVKRTLRKHSVVSRGRGAMVLTRTGNEIPVDDCSAPIRDAEGNVTGAVVILRDATERRLAEARLVHMAHHDALTGLPNRVLFQARLHEAIAQARRRRKLVGVLLLDLDNFKSVNDTLGHAAGDTLLAAAAERVRTCVRETDTVARLGGDELAVIQPDLDDPSGAATLANKLVQVFGQPFDVNGLEVTTTVSVGITVYPLDEQDPEEILRTADTAMYRAKAAGRNRFDRYSEPGSAMEKRAEFSEWELRNALARSEFEVFFQPIFDLQDQRVTGAEALLRWNHPEKGLIPASEFIHVAERAGLINQIVEMSMRKACEAVHEWSQSDRSIRVSVNLSETDLQRTDLIPAVASILDDASLAPEHLEIEVNERFSAERSRSLAEDNLRGLHDLGLPISLDGFGREYASMRSVVELSVGSIKIDRSLVKRVPDDPEILKIVKATVDVSEGFDVTVVAVGVESSEQLEWLRAAGCHQAQGYFLGPPTPMGKFFKRYIM